MCSFENFSDMFDYKRTYLDFRIENDEVTIVECNSNEAEIKIPKYIEGFPVTLIDKLSFYYRENLTSITIPDSVKNIGESAFSGCKNLTSITIPGGVISIGKEAFADCKKLTSATLKAQTIGESCFSRCENLEEVKLSNTIRISSGAFSNCYSMAQIDLPSTLKYIGSSAFYTMNENFLSVVVPNSVTEIGRRAFGYCLDNYYPLDKFIIYGDRGTAAEIYATDHKMKFYDRSNEYNKGVLLECTANVNQQRKISKEELK